MWLRAARACLLLGALAVGSEEAECEPRPDDWRTRWSSEAKAKCCLEVSGDGGSKEWFCPDQVVLATPSPTNSIFAETPPWPHPTPEKDPAPEPNKAASRDPAPKRSGAAEALLGRSAERVAARRVRRRDGGAAEANDSSKADNDTKPEKLEQLVKRCALFEDIKKRVNDARVVACIRSSEDQKTVGRRLQPRRAASLTSPDCSGLLGFESSHAGTWSNAGRTTLWLTTNKAGDSSLSRCHNACRLKSWCKAFSLGPSDSAHAESASEDKSATLHDCAGGSAASSWEPHKRAWCCLTQNLGCSLEEVSDTSSTTPRIKSSGTTSAGPHTSRPSSTTTPYDCEVDSDNWDMSWSLGKQAWCCKAVKVGCDGMLPEIPKRALQEGGPRVQRKFGVATASQGSSQRGGLWCLAVAASAVPAAFALAALARQKLRPGDPAASGSQSADGVGLLGAATA